MPVQHAPTVAMSVNHQRAYVTNLFHTAQADAVERNHRARATSRNNFVIMPLHRVEFVANVEGIHHALASAIGVGVDDPHDGVHTLVKRRVRRIRHQLVVLDEINSGFAENFHQLRRLLRRQADAGLDDCADERTALDFCQLARTSHTKFRSAKMIGERRRQFHVH